jgi:hypothetical protein
MKTIANWLMSHPSEYSGPNEDDHGSKRPASGTLKRTQQNIYRYTELEVATV